MFFYYKGRNYKQNKHFSHHFNNACLGYVLNMKRYYADIYDNWNEKHAKNESGQMPKRRLKDLKCQKAQRFLEIFCAF